MKKAVLKFSVIVLLLAVVLSLCSCSVMDFGMALGGSNYMTKDDVEKLLTDMDKNVTVSGGDTTVIQNITSNHSKNLLAASKGLLSAVSIQSDFEVTYTYSGGWGSTPGTSTTTKTSYGSGVIYKLDKDRGDAYIITNYHVVYNSSANTKNKISDDIKVFLYGQEYANYAISAKFIGGSPNYDIAVLKVSANETIMKSAAVEATFADSNKVSILDTAIAIGNPEAEGISATVGAINVDSETITLSNVGAVGTVKIRVLRTDAAVNSGNSGGGLFNDNGEVIGIVNAKYSESGTDNIGYAIPSNVAKNVADNIMFYDAIDPASDSVKRAIIGIEVGTNAASVSVDKESGKISRNETVVIAGVTSGSAADGKLAAGDIVNSVTVDGVTYSVTRSFHLLDAMLTVRKTDSKISSLSFNVKRGDEVIDVIVDVASAQITDY